MTNWVKRQGWWYVILWAWVFVAFRVEPFKSNFVPLILGSILVGLAGGGIEVAIRKMNSRRSM